MPKPWLSVVMPVHNGARDLPHTLASAAATDPEGVEFIILDSSTDAKSRDIVAAYEDRLDLHYEAMPQVKGWPEKTNLGVERARSPLVAMLHQDDIWLPGHIGAVRQSFSLQSSTVMSVASSLFIDVNGRNLGQWSLPLTAGAVAGAIFGRLLIVQNSLAIPSPVIRRDAWLAAGGLDPSLWYTADWDLYLKLARLGDVAVRPRVTTAFRLHGSSLTMTGSRNAGALREQFDVVLQRHGESFGMEQDSRLRARALASADINCALARGAAGQSKWLWPLMSRLLRLGPAQALRYLHESRIIDRIGPRLRARLAGNL